MTDNENIIDQKPDVSIIIPIYNTAPYLIECFQSVIKGLGELSYEVLLIDDGSTDDSKKIATDFADRNKGFVYYRLSHGGPGKSRNFGISKAKGKYIQFIDSDDLVAPKIIEDMFRAAEFNRADVTVCNVSTYISGVLHPSVPRLRSYSKLGVSGNNITSISEHPYFMQDPVVWNKLILCSFLGKHDFRFPEGVLYEDMIFAINLYIFAEKISYVRTRGYYWRRRGEQNSITQTINLQNFKEDLQAMEDIFCAIDEAGLPHDVRAVWENRVVNGASSLFYSNLNAFGNDKAEVLKMLADFYDANISSETVAGLPVIYKQIFEDIMSADDEHLKATMKFKANGYYKAPIDYGAEEEPSFIFPEDIIRVPQRNIKADYYYSVPISFIKNIELNDHILSIRGHLYLNRINVCQPEDEEIQAFLVNEITGASIPLNLKRIRTEYLTESLNKSDAEYKYCYDEAGFVIDIPLEELSLADKMPGKNLIVIKYKTPVNSGYRVLRGFSEEALSNVETLRYFRDDHSVFLDAEPDKTLAIHVKKKEDVKNHPLVSVIVPVYNVEPYISKCIDSLLNQSLKEMEFIFIDDRSTDASMAIVEEYKKKDPRIQTYYNEENIGAGPTRNKGIEIARGDYLSFVDPDDWVNEDFYKILYFNAIKTGGDISKGIVLTVDENGAKIPGNEPYATNAHLIAGVKRGRPLHVFFRYGHYSAIYSKRLFEDAEVRYGSTMVGEDSTFLVLACMKANWAEFTEKAVYYYHQRNTSIIHSPSYEKHSSGLESLKRRIKIFKGKGIDEHDIEYLRRAVRYYLEIFNDYLESCGKGDSIAEIEDYIAVLDKALSETGNKAAILRGMTEYIPIAQKRAELMPPGKVSVIVPIYNCAPFLEDLFDSLAYQSLDDYEVICVDDGSTDNSLDMIIEQCDSDQRFSFISKKNGGAGAARNEGLKLARGKYVMFVDADDRHSTSMLKDMYDEAEKYQTDIAIGRYDEYDNVLKKMLSDRGFDKKVFPDGVAVDPRTVKDLYFKIGVVITNKLFNRRFLIDNKLECSNTFVANDEFLLKASASVAKKIIGVHKKLFTVQKYINPFSISSNRAEHMEDTVKVYESIYEWIVQKDLPEEYVENYCRFFIYNIRYNMEFAYNHKYIAAVAENICTKEPWVSMDRSSFSEKYWKILDIAEYRKTIKDHQAALDEGKKIAGGESQAMIRRLHNRILAIKQVEKISEERYGIVLNPDSEEKQLEKLNQKLKKSNKKIKDLEKTLAREKSSWNYRIGAAATFVPKKAYRLLKKK